MTPLSDRYLTVSQAAQHLKISRQRVLQLIKAQVFKAEPIPIPGRTGFFYLLERKAVERRKDLGGRGHIQGKSAF